jgi:hypothetical protein
MFKLVELENFGLRESTTCPEMNGTGCLVV